MTIEEVHNFELVDAGSLENVLENVQETGDSSVAVMTTNGVEDDIDLQLQEDVNTLVRETKMMLESDDVSILDIERK